MSSAMNAKDIDLSKVTFSTPKTLDNGGKMLYLNYNGGMSPLYVTIPESKLPFEPSYYPDNDSSGKWSIKVSMSNLDTNKSMKEFHSKFTELDNYLMNKAVENSQAWFRKPKLSLETVKELYTPMVKCSLDAETGEPNGKYPDQFGFKVVKRDGRFPNLSIYDNKKTNFDINGDTDTPADVANILVQGCQIKAVLKCNGIWIANGKFGCTWRAEQVRVKVPEGGLRDFAILSDSDDEDVEEVEAVNTSKDVSNMIEDSSEEEEKEVETEVVEAAEESEDEVKEPEPEPVKKVVKKKRAVRVKKPEA
tara:strand:+ start:969 stop:1886 length:918 start_codon:yes stop_codon:yes gene_type:complete